MAHSAGLIAPLCGALLCAGLLGACHAGDSPVAAVAEPDGRNDEFDIVVAAGAGGRPVNRLILGNNVQWVDRGDDLLDAAGGVRPRMLTLARALQPGILRYPGGAQADTYHWRRGVGPPGARGENEHFNSRRMQPTIMGTQEFLEFCESVAATALISVNLSTGSAEEAAAWVALVNRQGLISRSTGRRLAAVKYWELGNEPYLQDDGQRALWISPEEFGRRAQAFIVAMRAVDPAIAIGLPLTNDRRNGYPATPYAGFTRRVLQQISAPFDFVSLHDAYLPYAMEREHTRDSMYWGAMAAAESVRADFAAMNALLHELRPAQHWPFALTEYNALFTLGRGAGDDLVASPAGALYVADLLRVLAQDPQILFANYWSLSGNWRFGAIRSDSETRPGYAVLALFAEALQGDLLAARVQAQVVDTPSVGGSGAVHGLPLVAALATRAGRTLRVVIIHKDPARSGRGVLHLRGAAATAARISILGWRDPWAVDGAADPPERSTLPLTGGADAPIVMPPHSVALVTLTLAN